MRYFLDTEFIERGPKHPLELISIGIVCEDGRELYCVSTDFKSRHASAWVKENVFPHLPDRNVSFYDSPRRRGEALAWKSNERIASDIIKFIGNDSAPEFWGYYCDYDWVLFCQLFGDMSDKPRHFPYFCNDLRQALDHEALHHINQPDAPHNALSDAHWIAETWRAHLNWGGEAQ